MKRTEISFFIEEYTSIEELNDDDRKLLTEARRITADAYAPYSHFHVGAAARMKNGQIVRGTNQENASFPVGLCAERVLISAASSLFPGQPIDSIAISYDNLNPDTDSNRPIAPCGVCRQTLQEFEDRMQKPIRLILGGMEGRIIIIPNAATLLPLAFSKTEMNRAE